MFMIGGKGYDVEKYALSGLTEDDIFWMDNVPLVSNGQDYNYFWRLLIKDIKFKDTSTSAVTSKYVIFNSRI